MDWTQAALDALAAELPLSSDAPVLSVRNEAGGAAQLDVDGVIGWDVTAASVRRALAGIADRDVTVRINSYGGSLFEGFSIHNQLARHKGKVTVLVDGVAASAASIIAMAGADIVMAPASFVMIHKAYTITLGDDVEHERSADMLRRVNDAAAAVYAARTGRDRAEVLELMVAETWMGPEDAISGGFANRIEGDAQAHVPEDGSAALLAAYRHAPAALRRLVPANAARRPDAARALVAAYLPPRVEPAKPKESPMSGPQNNAPNPSPAQQRQQQPNAAPQAATIAELETVVASSAGVLDAAWALEQLKGGATLQQASARAIEALAAAQPERKPNAQPTGGKADDTIEAMAARIQANADKARGKAA